MQNYRTELVNQIMMAGQSLIDNANDIVDTMDWHTTFAIELHFEHDAVPLMIVKQEHLVYVKGERHGSD